MATAQIHKYRVISLDVWGHGPDEHEKYDCNGECDGYTVNDAHYCGEIEVSADEHVYNEGKPGEFRDWYASDAEFVRALVVGGYLTPDCTEDILEIDGEADYRLHVDRIADGRPLLQLERSPLGGEK
jgi:hypothetical protein